MEGFLRSTNLRIASLDFSNSVFEDSPNANYYPRMVKPAPNQLPYLGPAEELSVVLALRHAEVLFSRLMKRGDYGEFAQNVVCSSSVKAAPERALDPFRDRKDYTLGRLANTNEKVAEGMRMIPTLGITSIAVGPWARPWCSSCSTTTGSLVPMSVKSIEIRQTVTCPSRAKITRPRKMTFYCIRPGRQLQKTNLYSSTACSSGTGTARRSIF